MTDFDVMDEVPRGVRNGPTQITDHKKTWIPGGPINRFANNIASMWSISVYRNSWTPSSILRSFNRINLTIKVLKIKIDSPSTGGKKDSPFGRRRVLEPCHLWREYSANHRLRSPSTWGRPGAPLGLPGKPESPHSPSACLHYIDRNKSAIN